ncbi:MAG: hypothetical protein ACJAYU_004343 [Bradymonadia bacterium]|jgi:hypothetical protein
MSEPLELDEVLARAREGAVAFEDVIDNPIAIEPKPRTLLIIDQRTVERGRPWHILGATMLLLGVVFLTVMSGRGIMRDFGVMTAVFAYSAMAVLLILRGHPQRVLREVPLLWLSAGLGVVRVREHPDQEILTTSSNIDFDDIDEVLFAQRLFRPNTSRAEVAGAAVFLRLFDGSVWPVIPATMATREAYNIALGVAQRIGVGVKQVGTGWADLPETESATK